MNINQMLCFIAITIIIHTMPVDFLKILYKAVCYPVSAAEFLYSVIYSEIYEYMTR